MENQTANDVEVGHLLSQSPPNDSPEGSVHEDVDEVPPQTLTSRTTTKLRKTVNPPFQHKATNKTSTQPK